MGSDSDKPDPWQFKIRDVFLLTTLFCILGALSFYVGKDSALFFFGIFLLVAFPLITQGYIAARHPRWLVPFWLFWMLGLVPCLYLGTVLVSRLLV